jgi:FixJ family two-component response regulator
MEARGVGIWFPGPDQRGSMLQPALARGVNEMPASPKSSNDLVVFVVDDDTDVRSGLKLLLESVGLPCMTFSSVDEFFLSKPTDCPSCLILDVRMPGTGGLDLQGKLNELQNRIPIIFITGHGDIPMTVKAMKAGAIEFLTKPLREQDVLDAVVAALDRDRLERKKNMDFDDLQARFDTLSEREREVMTFVIDGFLNKQTAAEIGLSEGTVKVHRHNLMSKLGARSLPDLVRIADALGIARPG